VPPGPRCQPERACNHSLSLLKRRRPEVASRRLTGCGRTLNSRSPVSSRLSATSRWHPPGGDEEAQSLFGGLLRKPAETPKILASRNPTKRFASSRRESWLPAPLPPPVFYCKLASTADERSNSLWFQRGLATQCEPLRLRLRRKSVLECPQSHSERTSQKSVRMEKPESFQALKNPAKTSRSKRSSRPRFH